MGPLRSTQCTMPEVIMIWLLYASTPITRPFTLSLRQPSAIQPEGRRETFVEFEGEGAASKDEGSAMLMLFIFGRGECTVSDYRLVTGAGHVTG